MVLPEMTQTAKEKLVRALRTIATEVEEDKWKGTIVVSGNDGILQISHVKSSKNAQFAILDIMLIELSAKLQETRSQMNTLKREWDIVSVSYPRA